MIKIEAGMWIRIGLHTDLGVKSWLKVKQNCIQG